MSFFPFYAGIKEEQVILKETGSCVLVHKQIMVSELPARSVSGFILLCNRSADAGLWSCVTVTLWINHVSSCSQQHNVCDLTNSSRYPFLTICLRLQYLPLDSSSLWPQICHHNV